jgi:hypothetical protein
MPVTVSALFLAPPALSWGDLALGRRDLVESRADTDTVCVKRISLWPYATGPPRAGAPQVSGHVLGLPALAPPCRSGTASL